jgi:Inorganic pyrophosphatase
VKEYTDLPEITLRQIEHFFCHYKDVDPGKWVKVERWGSAEEVRQIVVESIKKAKLQKVIPLPECQLCRIYAAKTYVVSSESFHTLTRT